MDRSAIPRSAFPDSTRFSSPPLSEAPTRSHPLGRPNTSEERRERSTEIRPATLGISAHLGDEPIGVAELVHMQRAPAPGCTHDPLPRTPHINKDAIVKREKLSLPIHVEREPSAPTSLPGSTNSEYTTATRLPRCPFEQDDAP